MSDDLTDLEGRVQRLEKDIDQLARNLLGVQTELIEYIESGQKRPRWKKAWDRITAKRWKWD